MRKGMSLKQYTTWYKCVKFCQEMCMFNAGLSMVLRVLILVIWIVGFGGVFYYCLPMIKIHCFLHSVTINTYVCLQICNIDWQTNCRIEWNTSPPPTFQCYFPDVRRSGLAFVEMMCGYHFDLSIVADFLL